MRSALFTSIATPMMSMSVNVTLYVSQTALLQLPHNRPIFIDFDRNIAEKVSSPLVGESDLVYSSCMIDIC